MVWWRWRKKPTISLPLSSALWEVSPGNRRPLVSSQFKTDSHTEKTGTSPSKLLAYWFHHQVSNILVQIFGDVVPILVPSCSLLDTDPHTGNSWDTKLSLKIRQQSSNPSYRLCLVSNQLHNSLPFINTLSKARMISIPDISDFKDDDLSTDWVITRGVGKASVQGWAYIDIVFGSLSSFWRL